MHSVDLKDAYWQISLGTITVPGPALYQITVMPFGLSNAPSTMTKLMDRIIPANLRRSNF